MSNKQELSRKEQNEIKRFNKCVAKYQEYKLAKPTIAANGVKAYIVNFGEPTIIGMCYFFLIFINIFFISILFAFKGKIWALIVFSLVLVALSCYFIVLIIRYTQEWQIFKKYKTWQTSNFEIYTRRTFDGSVFYVLEYSLSTPITGRLSYSDDISESVYEKISTLKELPLYLDIGKSCYEYKVNYKQIKGTNK